jgi:protoporphyrinogen oxidase
MASGHTNVAIIGAGISGLAVSHHLQHKNTTIFESTDHYSGHVHSEFVDGFTWDDGPHMSFSANTYVRDYLADMVDQEFETQPTLASNYYQGHWIGHPSQVHLFQIPEPLRTKCLESFLATRDDNRTPKNYREWLDISFGPVFAETFPGAYTRKYWTVEPEMLSTEWVGNRVMKPSVEQVLAGAKDSIGLQTSHYIAGKDTRYPKKGGFMAYTHKMAAGSNLLLNTPVTGVNFGKRELRTRDGSVYTYDQLVSTMPLKNFILASDDAPDTVREAAKLLTATNFLRVDVAVNHPAIRPETWVYVYDEDKYSVRISVTEKFGASNAPADCTGIQVEVYGSEYRPCSTDFEAVKTGVVNELIEMGMVESREHLRYVHCKFVPQGNPIFDLNRAAAMKEITTFLDLHGVQLVGRYGEHKYLMTDACIISARRAAARVGGADGNEFDASEVFISTAG